MLGKKLPVNALMDEGQASARLFFSWGPMAEIEMKQTANISALCVALSEVAPSLKVTIINLGGVRLNGERAEFLGPVSRQTVDLGTVKRREVLPMILEAIAGKKEERVRHRWLIEHNEKERGKST